MKLTSFSHLAKFVQDSLESLYKETPLRNEKCADQRNFDLAASFSSNTEEMLELNVSKQNLH